MVSGAAPVSAAAGTAPYDEAWSAPGRPRPHYAALLGRLDGADVGALAAEVERHTAEAGVAFGERAGPGSFVVDLVPRILTAAEWAELAAGLEQRVRALNAFLADAYGERRIVQAGLMDATVIDEAEGYEPDLQGRLEAGPAPVALAGLDMVRDPAGRLFVLEDNLRTPSGFAYAVAARTPSTPCWATWRRASRRSAGPFATPSATRCAPPHRPGPRASRRSSCSPTARWPRAGGSTSRLPTGSARRR